MLSTADVKVFNLYSCRAAKELALATCGLFGYTKVCDVLHYYQIEPEKPAHTFWVMRH